MAKVLLDFTGLVKGGGLQVGLGILHNAARTPGFEWHVALPTEMAVQLDDSVRTRFPSVTLFTQRTPSWRRIWEIRTRLPKLERSLKPDLVYTVSSPAYWRAKATHLLFYALPAPLYPESSVSTRVGPIGRLRRGLMYHLKSRGLSRSDYMVVETETVRRRLQQVLGYPSSRVFVVRNSFSQQFREELARADRDRSDGAPFRIFVPSAYYTHKNLEIIPAVAAALRKLTDRPFEFLLLLPPEGAPWARIRASAEALGVGGMVQTAGPVPHGEIARLYASSGAVFLPTLLECSSAVYPESFLAEVPLCTSDLDFARELCGDAALFVNPDSPEVAARALNQLMFDTVVRADLVRKGQKVLSEGYPTPEQKWQDHLDCFDRILNRAGA